MYDIGANVGFYTLLFSRLVGPAGIVHAFEPVARNLSYLDEHLRLNGSSNVRVHRCAVARETGTVAFDGSSGVCTGRVVPSLGPGANAVPAVSLDDFAGASGMSPPALIKMDVEGGEVDVLAGMPRLLAERPPVLLISVHGTSRWRDCVTILASAGYALLDLHGAPARLDAARDDLLALPPEGVGGARRREA